MTMIAIIRRTAVILAGLWFVAAAGAAPSAELWARWQKHNAAGTAVVTHTIWDDFLADYLSEANGIAVLDYVAVSATARQALRDYLQQLSRTAVDDLNRAEQLAYWINAYNALTVDLILTNYPVASIRDISPGLFSSGPWDEKLFRVAGEELSLNDIEHRILRPIWRDPRLHYAVNCASLGCPNLAARAYTAANTEALLDAGAKAYINHPRGVHLDGGRLTVSSIYEWFKEDFGGDDAGVIAHLGQYADAPLAADLAAVSVIDDDKYDWSLNKP